MIEVFLEIEKIKKERDGLDFRGAFPGAVRRAPVGPPVYGGVLKLCSQG